MHEASPSIVGIRLENLKPEVRSYVQKLRASLQVIYDRYEVTNRDELAAKVRKGIVKQEDIDKAIDLIRVINECGRKNEKAPMEYERRLIENERQKLEAFFGRKMEVPPLPEEISHERIRQWEKQKLELHYLPSMDLSKEFDHRTWFKKRLPNFKHVDESRLPEDYAVLPGCWVLVDAREKPRYDYVDQKYEDDQDFLGPVIEELRGNGSIEQSPLLSHAQSRFDISFEELKSPKVIKAMAETCGLKPGQVSIPRMIEFSVLGNIHHPEWGNGDCTEWFSDEYMAGQKHLHGGNSDDGGLANVDHANRGVRYYGIGFRILGRFK